MIALNYPACPRPGCNGPLVTLAAAGWQHLARTTDRLVCCTCNEGAVGTLDEFEQARLADKAWIEVKRAGVLGMPSRHWSRKEIAK